MRWIFSSEPDFFNLWALRGSLAVISPPKNIEIGPRRPCVRCAAIRIARLVFVGVVFVARGTAKWPARVDRVPWTPAIGDWRFGPSKPLSLARSEKLQNESFPNFSDFRPEFYSESCSEFPPNFWGFFVLRFVGTETRKSHQKSPPFFNAKFSGKFEEKIHKRFLESGQSNRLLTSTESGLCQVSSSGWTFSTVARMITRQPVLQVFSRQSTLQPCIAIPGSPYRGQNFWEIQTGGGLARKGPIGPKRALSGQFLLFPRGCGVQRNWSRSAPKRPRPALKWRQFAPKRPDFPGRISPRFSLKIWGLSPRLWAPLWIFPKNWKSGKLTFLGSKSVLLGTNFRGWRRVWGENRGRTGGELGENRGCPKEPGENRGHLEENRGRTGGFWYSFTKSTGGEAGALGQEPGENRGEGIFFETRDPTRDLKSTNRTAREN